MLRLLQLDRTAVAVAVAVDFRWRTVLLRLGNEILRTC